MIKHVMRLASAINMETSQQEDALFVMVVV